MPELKKVYPDADKKEEVRLSCNNLASIELNRHSQVRPKTASVR